MEFLNKILDWIIKHKKKTIFYAFLFFVVPIVLVQVAYSFPTFIPHFNSPLSAGDLLGYYAAFIATAGTVFLGFVAVKQNQIIAEKARQFQEYSRKQEIKANEPKLKCKQIEYVPDSSEKICGFPIFIVTISNVSENGASNIHIEDSYITYAKNSMRQILLPNTNIDYLEKFKDSKLKFKISLAEVKECKLRFDICYEDKYNETHKLHVIAYPKDYVASEWSVDNIYEIDNENK